MHLEIIILLYYIYLYLNGWNCEYDEMSLIYLQICVRKKGLVDFENLKSK